MNEPSNVPSEAEFQRIFPALDELAPAQVTVLLATLTAVRVGAGSQIVAPGSDNDSLYLIVSGQVRVTLETERVAVNLGEFGAGQWFGEMAMIDPAPATATVRAVDDCTLVTLSHAQFLALRRSHPDLCSILLLTFSNRLTGRLRQTLQHLDADRATDQHRGWLLGAVRRLMGVAARSAT
ncbi:MAG: cyclic nucleotide-binding domain-containing protein [Gammaproteobacteria bacterium]|nr:cyclic nucleotide-binding domain-containing protein [Gammaproteobacteria bacterium]